MTKNFVAAWPDEATRAALAEAGVAKKTVHLTTFFDRDHELERMLPFVLERPVEAKIVEVSMWNWSQRTRTGLVVARLEAPWATGINRFYASQSNRKCPPFIPHMTLERGALKGREADFQHLVGMTLVFDRHGIELDEH